MTEGENKEEFPGEQGGKIYSCFQDKVRVIQDHQLSADDLYLLKANFPIIIPYNISQGYSNTEFTKL